MTFASGSQCHILVGAFSVIVKTDGLFATLLFNYIYYYLLCPRQDPVLPRGRAGRGAGGEGRAGGRDGHQDPGADRGRHQQGPGAGEAQGDSQEAAGEGR